MISIFSCFWLILCFGNCFWRLRFRGKTSFWQTPHYLWVETWSGRISLYSFHLIRDLHILCTTTIVLFREIDNEVSHGSAGKGSETKINEFEGDSTLADHTTTGKLGSRITSQKKIITYCGEWATATMGTKLLSLVVLLEWVLAMNGNKKNLKKIWNSRPDPTLPEASISTDTSR